MNSPKWWFHSIDEIIEAPSDYDIFIPTNKVTFYSIEKLANVDPKFKRLLKRLKFVPLETFFGAELAKNFLNRKCAGFATSYNWDTLVKILGKKEMIIDEIRYDHVLDVRFVRKDLEFSDKMVKL